MTLQVHQVEPGHLPDRRGHLRGLPPFSAAPPADRVNFHSAVSHKQQK
jgi:hypothetical protein